MIVDTSVLIAMLKKEPERAMFSDLLARNPTVVSAGTLAEMLIVAGSYAGDPGVGEVETILRDAGAVIEPVDAQQARVVGQAYRRYGRGSQHPAKLNYGDCFSYALAIARDEPLLFKGDDFVHTDVRVAAAEI